MNLRKLLLLAIPVALRNAIASRRLPNVRRRSRVGEVANGRAGDARSPQSRDTDPCHGTRLYPRPANLTSIDPHQSCMHPVVDPEL
jgi:hypothetical protein